MPTEADRPAFRIPKPHEKVGNRRLTRTRRADEGDRLACGNDETRVVYGAPITALVLEIDGFEFNRQTAACRIKRHTVPIRHWHRLVVDRIETARRTKRIRQLTAHIRDFGDRQKRRH